MTLRSTRRHSRSARLRLGALVPALVAVAVALAGAARGQQGEDEVRGFSIPSTPAARNLVKSANDHLRAERWSEALEALQELLEWHGRELILDERLEPSEMPVHRGVAGWVAERLVALPSAVASLYRRRHDEEALASLELARRRGDRQAVIAVAERWPICEASALAWWTAGDLELERGCLPLARWAWSRALLFRLEEAGLAGVVPFDGARPDDWRGVVEGLATRGVPLGEGEARRVALAASTLEGDGPLAADLGGGDPPAGSLRLPGEGEGARGAPGPRASAWPRPFRVPTPGALEDVHYEGLWPIRVGDLVLLSNSLQLLAVNAYSGTLAWQSDLPEGWTRLTESEQRDFFAGVSTRDTMIVPAASGEIAVAALQVPVTDLTNASYRNIAITTVIPDRRLYAFDLATGRELWNHHPPLQWDGETGTFTQRMSVAGPPVVTGSRIVVPMHRMYGRIEFYVACFDLETGALLWATQLVSGQRELNMFARAEEEFSAPPVRIEGDAVIALTQLGAIASLDLFSGRLLWETLYPQVPIVGQTERRYVSSSSLWRNAPPVVADGVVVATPYDGKDLLGLDLATGEARWHLRHSEVESLARGDRRETRIDVLLGADERCVYLGSWPVVALRASGGLYTEAPSRLAWRFPSSRLGDLDSDAGRALLLADRVIIPRLSERIEVDRFSGSLLEKRVPWETGRCGNLLVDGGTMYSLTPRFLDGYFEWDALLRRAREEHEADPEAQGPTIYLAGLLVQRGGTESEEGRGDLARDWLDEAVLLLESLAGGEPMDPQARLELHRALRTRARVSSDLADTRSAVRDLRRARDLAPDAEAAMSTLLVEHELLRDLGDTDEQRAVLTELEQTAGTRHFLARLEDDSRTSRGWRLVPTSLGEESDPYDPAIDALPVSLWISLERCDLAARTGDVEGELFHLHRLIELWPQVVVRETPLAEVAAGRIRELVALHGRVVYSPFEERARELLAQARRGHDPQPLRGVSELYPQSLAGREANDELLRWAVGDGDVGAVAEIVESELPEVFSPEEADDRQLVLLLHLGAVLERAGNRELPATLYRALAERAPDLVSPVADHGGRSLGDLAREETTPAVAAPPPSTFTADALVVPGSRSVGKFAFLGRVPPPRSPAGNHAADVLLYAEERHMSSEVSLVAYSSDTVAGGDAEPLWERPLPRGETSSRWEHSIALVPGLVVVASRDGVYARGRDSGDWRWSWPAMDGDVDSVRAAGGVILVTERGAGGTDSLHALDEVTGERLWSAPIDRLRHDLQPVCGERWVVLLPKVQRTAGVVHDLFTGGRLLDFELPERVIRSAPAASWIERGKLIVPWFMSGRSAELNRVVAIDLSSGELAWNLSFDDIAGGRRELRSIVQHDGHTYLHLSPCSGTEREGVRGILVELHASLGATARVGSVELDQGDRLIGIPQERRVVLDEPFLYLRSFPPGGDLLRLQALQLPYGNLRWTQRLKVPRERMYNAVMRLPASSETTVALAISTKTTSSLARETSLYFFDRSSGVPQGNLLLDGGLGGSDDISLQGLGGALILAGENLLEVMR